MVDPMLAAWAAEPLKDGKRINGIFLPQGKKPQHPLSEAERIARSAEQRLKASNKRTKLADKKGALLDYYAATEMSADKIADLIGMRVEDARVELAQRGRK